jgi:hypothetical protein
MVPFSRSCALRFGDDLYDATAADLRWLHVAHLAEARKSATCGNTIWHIERAAECRRLLMTAGLRDALRRLVADLAAALRSPDAFHPEIRPIREAEPVFAAACRPMTPAGPREPMAALPRAA